LWKWYGKWSGEIAGYQPRRDFLSALFAPVIGRLQQQQPIETEPTGLERARIVILKRPWKR
jgi:hypothetical protein